MSPLPPYVLLFVFLFVGIFVAHHLTNFCFSGVKSWKGVLDEIRTNNVFRNVVLGFLLGLTIALLSLFCASTFMERVVSGAIVIAFMVQGVQLTYVLWLRKLDVAYELSEKKDKDIGYILIGIFVSNGLLILGVLFGANLALDGDLVTQLAYIVAWWGTGQTVFVFAAWNLHKVCEGRIKGVYLCCLLILLGIIFCVELAMRTSL